MEKMTAEKLPLSEVHHVGVIVADMDKAVEHYEALGIGPFEPVNLTLTNRKQYGKPADHFQTKVKWAQIGEIRFELIQPVSGESLQQKRLVSKGEGINHICFSVGDIDKGIAEMTDKGFKVVSTGRFVEGGGFAYFNTDKVGGVIFELQQSAI